MESIKKIWLNELKLKIILDKNFNIKLTKVLLCFAI